MKNLFKFLASMVYPFLISLFVTAYCELSHVSDFCFFIALILTIIFGVIATVGIIGNIVVLSIDAHKERKNAKVKSKTDKE